MKIIKFGSDTKHRKQWFTGISFSHPAKMSLPLQLWLIDNFTKEGEVILDPMAGSGTILVACSMGRNVIAVDLEQKFVDMMKGNWEKIQQRGCQLGYSMGTATILQGDARQLEGLLMDKCIFSPPYTNRMDGGIRGSRAGMKPYTDESPDSWFTQRDQKNIGNLPYGEIDKIITSPPFGEAQSGGGIAQKGYQGSRHSPTDLVGKRSYMPENTGNDPGNIQRLPYGSIDAVITSPPYELTAKGRTGGICGRDESVKQLEYSHNQGNIGNLKGESYLSAMLEVYQGCWRVLKPQGLMILVTKNFIRNKQEIRLDLDTIKLCEQAGFNFQDRWYRELANQSFWRTIYHQKYPDVEPIKYEDVLIFKK